MSLCRCHCAIAACARLKAPAASYCHPANAARKLSKFEREQFLRFREALAARDIRIFAQLLHRLQSHFGIFNIANQAPDAAQAAIGAPKPMMAYLRRQETQGSARLLQMLQCLMNRRSLAVAPQCGRGDRRLDFFASNPWNRPPRGAPASIW